mgnify:CR=1 FL=1
MKESELLFKDESIRLSSEYEAKATEFGLPTFKPLPLDDYFQLIQAGIGNKEVTINFMGQDRRVVSLGKRESLPKSLKFVEDPRVRLASIWYLELVKPLLATGKDSYKPSEEDIEEFVQKATSEGEGINFVIYYALSKTQSPARTGSPDNIIDLAELEMLRYWASIIEVGKKIGVSAQLTIIDESSELPQKFLGFSPDILVLNHNLSKVYLQHLGVSDGIVIKTLTDSVRGPLGEDFEGFYQPLFSDKKEALIKSLQEGVVSPEFIRMRIFLECMTPDTWNLYNIEEILGKVEKPEDIFKLPKDLRDFLINLTAHFNAIMGLRETAGSYIQQSGSLDLYPEYDLEKRVYGGVTRSQRRWSFLPNPVKYKGQTRNPMHGLSFYDHQRNFGGYIPFNEALRLGDQVEIVYNGNKPLFVVQK